MKGDYHVYTIILLFSFSENKVEILENGEVGEWGGLCRCPDGGTYQVADVWDYCKSIACYNGKMMSCHRYGGEWSGRKVTCLPGQGKYQTTTIKHYNLISLGFVLTKFLLQFEFSTL